MYKLCVLISMQIYIIVYHGAIFPLTYYLYLPMIYSHGIPRYADWLVALPWCQELCQLLLAYSAEPSLHDVMGALANRWSHKDHKRDGRMPPSDIGWYMIQYIYIYMYIYIYSVLCHIYIYSLYVISRFWWCDKLELYNLYSLASLVGKTANDTNDNFTRAVSLTLSKGLQRTVY